LKPMGRLTATPESLAAQRRLLERVMGECLERLTAGCGITAMSFHEDPEEETIHYSVDITFRREDFETDRTVRKHMRRLAEDLQQPHVAGAITPGAFDWSPSPAPPAGEGGR
jgi:hypothetical protein